MILTFLAYDWFVKRHNQMVVGAAARATEFCHSLSQERSGSPIRRTRIGRRGSKTTGRKRPQFDLPGNKARLNSFLNNDVDEREKIRMMTSCEAKAYRGPIPTPRFCLRISGFTA
jgi:hypothetical protein